jgi:exodeoxyribonuclease VII small subunit
VEFHRLSEPRPGADVDEACAEPRGFETSLAELEQVVRELEEGQLGLSEALARYEHGIGRLKHCYSLLEAAERKVELLTGMLDDGTPVTQPLPESSEPLAESTGRRRNGGRPRRGSPASHGRGDVDDVADSL